MKKLSLILMLFFLIGCEQSIESFEVIGDLTEDFSIETYATNHFSKMKFENETYQVIETKSLYDALPLVHKNNVVYFESYDGFMNKLDASTLQDTYLGYKDDKWYFLSEKHPPNSGIKDIEAMLIVKDTDKVNRQYGLNIVNGETEDQYHFSVGELYLQPYQVLKNVEGVSEKSSIKVASLSVDKVIKVSDLVEDDFNLSLMMTSEGDYNYISNEGYIVLDQHSLNYIQNDSLDVFKDLKGIMINPPSASNLDVYDDARMHLDEKALIVFIDGFSINQMQYLKASNHLSKLPYEKANTVFKPVTNAGFAAMITGQPPKMNGILNRSFRQLKTEDIFEYAVNNGYRAALVEGDIKILDTSINPILNLDNNENGFTDDEIHESALKAVHDNYDLLMVHYHSLDETGHDYGPDANETISRLQVIDEYVGELLDLWDGYVIITSDHGMHKTQFGGDHGEFRYEDLMVPYFRRTNE